MRYWIAAIAVLLLQFGAIWELYESKTLMAKDLETAQDSVKTKQKTIEEMQDLQEQNSKVQSELTEKVIATGKLLNQKQRDWETLKRENATLNAWAISLLPDDVQRLRQRPEIRSTSEYHQWLSKSRTMHPAGQQPEK